MEDQQNYRILGSNQSKIFKCLQTTWHNTRGSIKHHNFHTRLQMDLGGKNRFKVTDTDWLCDTNMTRRLPIKDYHFLSWSLGNTATRKLRIKTPATWQKWEGNLKKQCSFRLPLLYHIFTERHPTTGRIRMKYTKRYFQIKEGWTLGNYYYSWFMSCSSNNVPPLEDYCWVLL